MSLTPEQEESVRWLLSHDRGLLISGMGTGKSLTTLTALSLLPPDAFPALVLAPPTVSEAVWEQETEKWGIPLLVRAAPRTPAHARREALSGGLQDVTVLSDASIRDAVDIPWRTVVVDEASRYETPSSTRSESVRAKALRAIAKGADRVWLLTGTPGADPIGVWSLIRMLDGGESCGSRVTQARDMYLTPGRRLPSGAVIGREPRPRAMSRLVSRASHLIRQVETPLSLNLPGVRYERISPVMGPVATAMSLAIRETGVYTLPDGREIYTSGPGQAAGLMHQATTGGIWWRPPLTPDATPEYVQLDDTRPSVDAAVREAIALREQTGRGVLIFHWFRHEEAPLMEALGHCGSAKSKSDRGSFTAGRLPYLLAHPASAGHGLNLQAGGQSMVWATLPWSLELWEQANARLARPGQEADTVTCRFISPTLADGSRSVAQHVEEALAAKKEVQDEVPRTLGLLG